MLVACLCSDLRFDFTNFRPFDAYGVEGWWLDNLLKSGKLSRQAYLSLAARVTVGFQKRLADLWKMQSVLRYKHLKVRSGRWKLFQRLKPFSVVSMARQHFRRPVLAIVGGTRLGKSMLANDVLQRLADKLGVASYIEVTVENDDSMDLADFDRRRHSGVLLDGVGDVLFLKRNREALQGRSKAVKGARSATNVYSYSFSFCGRAVVATFDLQTWKSSVKTTGFPIERMSFCCGWILQPFYRIVTWVR